MLRYDHGIPVGVPVDALGYATFIGGAFRLRKGMPESDGGLEDPHVHESHFDYWAKNLIGGLM